MLEYTCTVSEVLTILILRRWMSRKNVQYSAESCLSSSVLCAMLHRDIN